MILELIRMAVVFLLHFLAFLSLGTLLLKALKKEEFSLSMAVITGYFAYFALFEVITLPMIFTYRSLSFLTMVMSVIMASVILATVIVGGRDWLRQVKGLPGALREHSWVFFVVAAAVLFQCYAVAVYYDTSADAAYYVGIANTAVYTDTLQKYSPYTGAALGKFMARYVFSCFPLHNAFISRMTGIPVIIQAKTVMAVANALIANMLYYQIGRCLFREKSRKWADIMVAFLCVIQLFCDTIYQPGTFFFTRLYEGKAILANLVLPMILYCSLRNYRNDREKAPWIYLFLCNLAAVSFSGSAMIAAFAGSAVTVPLILLRRRFRLAVPYILCQLPVVCWFAAYYLSKTGVISLKITG